MAFGLEPKLCDPHALDRIGLVMRNADRVIVSTPLERRLAWSTILKGANVAGEVIDETVAQLSATGARNVGGQGLLQVSVGPLGLRDQLSKRLFDLTVAVVGLVVLAPLLLVVALAVKLDDGGRVFFVQRRVGRGNRFFPIYKFRSMTDDPSDPDGTISTTRDDKRITRVGRIIRRSSIDELPQIFNVLRGDMSLVGPRPERPFFVRKFAQELPGYMDRHAAPPGITGWAQINGCRGDTSVARRLQLDLEYVRRRSLRFNLWILLLTPWKVLVDRNAY
jgi:exopolysaccharide biosynthesis polyprenyl glycosylphosphotransferase